MGPVVIGADDPVEIAIDLLGDFGARAAVEIAEQELKTAATETASQFWTAVQAHLADLQRQA